MTITDLKDGFKRSGSEFDDFKGAVDDMVECTKDIVVRGGDIIFLSLCEIPEHQTPGKYTFYVLSSEYITDFLIKGKALRLGTVPEEKIPEELMEECARTTKLIAVINNEKYIVSDRAIPTLSLRASVSGDRTINYQNLIRNMHFADAIINKNENIHVAYREVEGIKKIFACLGSQYSYIPQNILVEAADLIRDKESIGESRVDGWLIDHDFTDLYVSLDGIAKEVMEDYKLPHAITPHIFLCTSDTGSSSIIARSCYASGRGYVILDEVMIRHVGKITADDILDKIDKTILPNIRKLPERLAELIGIPVMDYTGVDLTTEAGAAANFKAVSKIIEKTLKSAFKGGVFPQKRTNALLECLVDEINSSVQYTLYDIAMIFMELSGRIEGVDDVTITNVQKACATVPFKISAPAPSPSEKEEADIYLIPA